MHEIVLCKYCGKTIRQCRCMDHNKPTRYEVCLVCKALEAAKVNSPERDAVIKSACVCGSCKRWDRADELCLAFDKHKSRKDTCDKWEEIK